MNFSFRQVLQIGSRKQYNPVQLANHTQASTQEEASEIKARNRANLQSMGKANQLAISVFGPADGSERKDQEKQLKMLAETLYVKGEINEAIVTNERGKQLVLSLDPTRIDPLAAIGL